MPADRALLRAGFLLVLLGLLTGTVVGSFASPRLALAAHLTGVLNGLLLAVLGLAWEPLRLSPGLGRLVRVLFLYGAYANWGATVLGALWGTSRLTPIAGAGFSAAPWKELVVQALLLSLVVAMLLGVSLLVYALRPRRAA